MKFNLWLETVGDVNAARILGVSARAARSWRTGVRTPKPVTAKKIAEKLKGKVTIAEIYG